jgi:Uma2 family endonuclease
MATAIVSPPEAPALTSAWFPYRMTAEEYFRAIEADVFQHQRRIELWEGQIYEKMAKKLPHSGSHSLVLAALFRALPNDWSIWSENPILVDDFTAPLPDVTVIRGTPHVYTSRGSFPKFGEIGLVVEVAETSLRKNLTDTLKVYARAELPYYWVVNLVVGRVEVYSEPRVDGDLASYGKAEMFGRGQDVPVVLDNHEVARIPVNDLLPLPKEATR